VLGKEGSYSSNGKKLETRTLADGDSIAKFSKNNLKQFWTVLKTRRKN
jgi:hypothetical protein